MKTKTKIFGIIFSAFIFTSSAFAGLNQLPSKPECDSIEVIKLYSLFSEYHKNKDYQSALPYGWQVLECDKEKFAKWIYYKMEDCMWFIHDSAGTDLGEEFFIDDSILTFYDMGMKYYPDGEAYFQVRKAFVSETWLNLPADVCIAEYVKAYKLNPDMDTYYLNRLGQLYFNNQTDDNDYYDKALELYSDWAIREPDNPIPREWLQENANDPTIILDANLKTWELDPENLQKAWNYASTCIRYQEYERAIPALEFLTDKAPETVNYWNQLATCYNKVGQTNDAEKAYEKLIDLEPDNKDFYFNLGLIYKGQGKLSKARQYFETASSKAGGWGAAIYTIGLIYEQAASNCNDGWESKLVYLLAQDTYKRALSIDPSLSQARDRKNALSSAVPSQEDIFFHKLNSGDVVPITGDCFTWIGKSVTIP